MKEIKKIESKIKKNQGFKVPDKYFDELGQKIIERIHTKPKAQPKILGLSKKHFAYAASFIGFLVILYSGYLYINNTSEKYEVTADDITEYLNTYEYNMDVAYIINEYGLSNTEYSSVNSEELIEYLLSENIDYYTIIDEYY